VLKKKVVQKIRLGKKGIPDSGEIGEKREEDKGGKREGLSH